MTENELKGYEVCTKLPLWGEEQGAAVRNLVREVRLLRKVLLDIKEFACAHHSSEISSLWLHSLLVDIPQMVNACLQAPERDE